MAGPIPEAKRRAAVDDYLRRKAEDPTTSIHRVALDHGVGEASLKRWLWRAAPGRPRGGWSRLTPALVDELVALVTATPSLRLHEVAAEMSRRAGFEVTERMVSRALRARGIGKRRLVRDKQVAESSRPSKGTRYTERHRRKPEDRPDRQAYPSDFTDAEWAVVGPIWLQEARALPTEHELREVLNALRYIGATGCPWRFLPHEYPPFTTARTWFDRWKRDGTVERVNAELRRRLRRRAGREDTPSILIIDSQSVKAREGGVGLGYDGAKKLNGRKRHVAVDTMGLPWLFAVQPANVQDRDGIDEVVPADVRTNLERLDHVLGDGGYQGRAEQRTLSRTGVPLKIARKRGDNLGGEWAPLDGPPPTTPAGFHVITHRWIVERSHSWVGRRRRLSSDFERRPDTSAEWYRHAWQVTMAAQLAG